MKYESVKLAERLCGYEHTHGLDDKPSGSGMIPDALAEIAYEARVAKRADLILNDKTEFSSLIYDNYQIFDELVYRMLREPADVVKSDLVKVAETIALTRARLEVKPDDMDGFVEPMEYPE